jgi:hypothetical protein
LDHHLTYASPQVRPRAYATMSRLLVGTGSC